MAANVGDVDVVTSFDSTNAPKCPHGPTLLFVKYAKDGSQKRFFACSACRDRADCDFFQWETDSVTREALSAREENNKLFRPPFNHEEFQQRYRQFLELPFEQRALCQQCGLLLMRREHKRHRKKKHILHSPIDSDLLTQPTKLFQPDSNSKKYAQYMFSKTAVDFAMQTLYTIDSTHVLCVGAPRIHEAIQRKPECQFKSLLLDIDYRYEQIYSEGEFCRYNMFTHYFFDGKKPEKVFKNFIKNIGEDEKLVVIIDPPFGGMVEPLAESVKKIMAKYRKNHSRYPSVLWFFPYFMEQRISECLPSLSMLDYKVDYDNHSLFKNAEKKQKKSPVRIFTNVPPIDVYLPKEEGYWYCEECMRYSSSENQHCDMCERCTSKDGSTYVHCFKCERCVKPNKDHCATCKSCQPKNHKCTTANQPTCHLCGNVGHKRKQCPQQNTSAEKRKKLASKDDT